MAILQEANAVFYHPLDTLTESLQAQAWTGSSKDQIGRVALSKAQAPSSVAYGGTSAVASGGPNSTFPDSDTLDPTHIVGAIVDLNNTVVSCAVGTVTGTALAYGAKSTFSSSAAVGASVAAVSATTFVVVHNTVSRVATVSGTDITFGANATIPGSPNGSGMEAYTEVIALSASVVLATFPSSGNTVKAVAGVVGATVSWGTEQTIATLGTTAWIRPARMAADRLIVTYGTRVGNDPIFVRGVSVVGLSIALPDAAVQAGTAMTGTTIGGFSGQSRAAIVGIDSRTAVLAYFGGGSPSHAFLRAVDMPATAPTVGPGSIMSDAVGMDFETRGIGEPLFMSIAWDGAHVALNVVQPMQEGAVSGAASTGQKQLTVYLVSLNEAGLPVERGVSNAFLVGNLGDHRSSVAGVSAGKFAVSSHASGGLTTKIGAVTPLRLSAAGADGTTAFGAEAEFESGATAVEDLAIDVSALDGDRFVVAYGFGAGGPQALCRVGTVAGTSVVFGTAAGLGQNSLFTAVAALDATKFVVAYTTPTGSAQIKVGTVSGTDITYGALAGGSASVLGGMSLTRLDATRVVLAHAYSVATNIHAGAAVWTVSGTSLTTGAITDVVSFAAGSWVSTRVRAIAMDSSRFAILYGNPFASGDGTANIGTVAGADITYGPPQQFATAPISEGMDGVAMSSSTLVVAWADTGANGFVRAASVTGNLLSWNTAAVYEATTSVGPALSKLDSSTFVVAYNNSSINDTFSRVGTVAGTSISLRDAATMRTDDMLGLASAALSAAKFVVCYRDTSDANHGTAQAAQVAAYPTTVGATRLAFSTWSRRGMEMSAGAETSVATGLSATSRLIVAALSDTAFMAAYSDASFVRTRILTLTGTSIAVGAESTVTGAAGGNPADVAALSPTKVVIAVGHTLAINRNGYVGTVSGTDITWGPAWQFDFHPTGGVADPLFLEALDAVRVLLVFSFSGAGGSRYAQVGVATGTTISWGPQSVGRTNSTGNVAGLAVLSEFTAVVTSLTVVTPPFDNVVFDLVSIAGSAASFAGSATELPELNRMDRPRIAPIDSSRFLIAYNDDSDGASPIFAEPDFRQTFARVVTVTGTDFSVGPKSQLDGSPVSPVGLVRISDRRLLLAYAPDSNSVGDTLYAATAGVDGTTVSFGCSRIAVGLSSGLTQLWTNAIAASGGTVVLMTDMMTQVDAVAVAVKE